MGHITVRISWFESLGNSIGKIACKNIHIIELVFFLKILYIPSVILSVYTGGMMLSVYIDRITDEI
jgi:hypothetical protein